jgi:O-antigen/teichoic acid export membrane protein
MTAAATWIIGLVVFGVFGAIVSNWIVFPNYGMSVGVWGFIVGAIVFMCLRLLFTGTRNPSS